MRALVGPERVARLATVGPDGSPHLVPITFALAGEEVVFVVDGKPKTTTRLKRLVNIELDPRVSVLVDHYEDDWSRLWWVRIDGTATIVGAGPDLDSAVTRLTAKYAQYRDAPPAGPVVSVRASRWTGWTAGSPRRR